MATWKSLADIKAPDRANYATLADFILAYRVIGDVENATSATKFLGANPDPQYATPQAYITATILDAQNITKFSSAFAPQGWDAISAGVAAAMQCFTYLSELPVNAGDPATVSIMDAWVAKTGQLYGGHPATVPNTGDGTNAATGPSSVETGTIFGGSKSE